MIWKFKAGSTWNAKLADFCGDITNNITYDADYVGLVDLVVETEKTVWLFELTHNDLRQKLFPKDGKTCLIEELDRMQCIQLHHTYHVFTVEGMYVFDEFSIENMMNAVNQTSMFPSVKPLIYLNQENAIKGIYNMVKENRPWQRLPGLATKQPLTGDVVARALMQCKNVTAEKGQMVRDKMVDKPLCEAAYEVYPKLKDGSDAVQVKAIKELSRLLRWGAGS